MKTFDIKTPSNWQKSDHGDILEFPCSAGNRRVNLMVNATGPVAVYTATSADMADKVLVGYSDGLFAVSYAASETTFVEVIAAKGTVVYLNGIARSQIVQAKANQSHTSVMPKGRRNSDLDRMMQVMNLNEKRREQAFQRELARVNAIMAEKVASAPAPAPTPAPTSEEVTANE